MLQKCLTTTLITIQVNRANGFIVCAECLNDFRTQLLLIRRALLHILLPFSTILLHSNAPSSYEHV